MKKQLLTLIASLAIASAASAQVLITEWMYDGSEFIEFTNVGSSSVDLTGWSYSDDTLVQSSLSSFGTISAGESVIVAQAASADAFRSTWSLAPSVKVLAYSSGLLQRGDVINLFNASSTLVDKLAYGDNTIGGPRTNTASGVTTPEYWGAGLTDGTAVTHWQLSTVSDGYSWTSTSGGFVANPGVLAVPEPASWALLGLASTGLMVWRKRRRS